MIRKTAAILLYALALCGPLHATEPWDERPFSVAPDALLKAAKSTGAPEGTAVVVLSEDYSFTFDAAGRRTYNFHRIYSVLTAAGVRGWDTTELRWEPWHENKPALRARVVTSDGAVHELDQKTIAETPVGENNETYSDARVLKAPLPGIAAGCVVEEEIAIVETAPVMEGGIVRRIYFGGNVPTQHTTMTVDVPASSPLRFVARLLPDIETKRTEQDGRVRVTFTQGAMKAIDDVESYLPFDAQSWPNVVFSTGASWSDVGARYNKLVEDQLRGADLHALLAKVDRKNQSRLQLAAQLLRELHSQLRYTGVEFREAAYVPRTPAELLKRKFGDCKDQSALLVAMLRSVGIPAHVALLDSGTGLDIEPGQPGWGGFDHAIVYVPAGDGNEAMWADPTSEYSRFNELPLDDRGRHALIVDSAATLIMTPDARPSDNRFVETREFHLAELGRATVTETSVHAGSIEVYYRNDYTAPDPKKLKKMLDGYVKDAYYTDAPATYSYSKVDELSKPFELKVATTGARRGTTAAADAAVGIPIGGLAARLPDLLRTAVSDKEPKRKLDLVLPEPYVGEWNYRIVAPPGFRPAPLPDSGTVKLGPATLTKSFEAHPDGTVTATLRFDCGKWRYTAAEVEELRAAVVQLQSAPMVLVRFEQIAYSLLHAGRIREALDEYSKLVKLHPKEALHHSQIASALLEAGAGDAARKEASLAVELEPNDAEAQARLGWILEHDLVGRRFEKGCDLTRAETAYRRAVELKPDDLDTHTDLAILLEHAPSGERYRSQEKLKQALTEYRAMDGKLANGYENNILFCLFWTRNFDELQERAAKSTTAAGQALLLSAVAVKQGAAAAIAEARKRVGEQSARRDALSSAGEQLMRLRMYSLASPLLDAAAEGSDKAEAFHARAQMFAKTVPYEDAIKRMEPPVAVLAGQLVHMFLDEAPNRGLADMWVAGSDMRSDKAQKEMLRQAAPVRTQMRRNNIAIEAVMDFMLSSAQFRLDGDDTAGYRVRGESLTASGSYKFTAYVVREKQAHKLLSVDDVPALGAAALEALERGDPASARRLLDWAREKEQLSGGEDPLAGYAFPRFWTKGADPGADAIRFAAASLMGRTLRDAVRALPILLGGEKAATDAASRTRFQLALYEAYNELRQFDKSAVYALSLLHDNPRSDAAFGASVLSLSLLNRWSEVERVIADRLKLTPDDVAVPRMVAMAAMRHGDFAKVVEQASKVIALGEAGVMDFNNLAWAALMGNQSTPQALEAAQNAVKADKGASFGTLHTLASVYAETGKTKEAREIILHAMEIVGQSEPDGNSWYVFGRIAEQYGLRDAALADYQRVERPEFEEQIPGSTWNLARSRIATLNAPSPGTGH